MQVLVNSNLGVSLADAGNFQAFELRVAPGTDRARLAAALQNIAELEGGEHAWILESWLLHQLVQQSPAAGWRAQFDAMSAYASKKGWLRYDPTAIRAHIVFSGG